MRLNTGTILCLAMAAMLTLCSAADSQTSQPTSAPSFSPEKLREAAEQTYVNFNKAWQAGDEKQVDQIAPKYWAEPIQSLKPIRVYLHRANVVVVQREQDGDEEGKYFYLLISSYLPMSGVDGFTYAPNPVNGTRYSTGSGAFDYKRTVKQ